MSKYIFTTISSFSANLRYISLLSWVVWFCILNVRVTSADETDDWVRCAGEDQLCSFEGSKNVRYGANEHFVYKERVGSTLCSNRIFGDPIMYVVKACYLLGVNAPEAPSKPTAIGDENKINRVTWNAVADATYYEMDVALEGKAWFPVKSTYTAPTAIIEYPDAGQSKYRIRACNDDNYCSKNSPESDIVDNDWSYYGWVKCADEQELCEFEGVKNVYYGANEKFIKKELSNGTLCSNPVFGDPIVGTVKACYLRNQTAQVSNLNLPDKVRINTNFHVSWGEMYGASNYKLYVDGVELQTISSPSTDLNFSVVGEYEITIQACYATGCGEHSTAKSITVYTPETNGFIVDNLDTNTVIVGDWNLNSDLGKGWADSYYAPFGADSSFTWLLSELPSDGYYEVYAWWTTNTSRSSQVPIDIVHEYGVSSLTVDQTGSAEEWNLLGTYNFTPGETQYIKLYGEGLSFASADAIRLVRVGDVQPPLIEVFYPGSEEGQTTSSGDAFVAKVTATSGNEAFLQKVEFSINGVDWYTATNNGHTFEYDFGLLDAGNYTLQVRINEHTVSSVLVTIEDVLLSKPAQISNLNLPVMALVETDFSITWQPATSASLYKLYIDGVESQILSVAQATLNFPIIGNYNVQVAACNEVGCSELSPTQGVVIYHTELNFNDFAIDSYAGDEDVSGTVEVTEGGRGISLQGNIWKQIQYNYTVGVHTILAFDFSSSEQGEIHGIGLSSNLDESLANTFQVFGTENCCISEFNDYPGGGVKKHYEIMIGQYYRGEFNHLFFIMDEDSQGHTSANSIFSAVHLYEEIRVPPIAIGLDIVSTMGIGQVHTAKWISVPEATHYRVNINGELYQTVTDPSVDLHFNKLGQYILGVQACNDFGCNIEAESQLTHVLPAPDKVVAIRSHESAKIIAQDFSISWDNLNNASEYKLYVDGNLQFADVLLPVTTLNITSAGEHNVQVQACNNYGCGELSEHYQVTIIEPPLTVQNLSLAKLTATGKSVPFTWKAAANTDYYEITIDGNLYTSVSTNSGELSISNAGSYVVQVRACNAAGCGKYSLGANIVAQALPGAVFDITVPSGSKVGEQILVSWSAVVDASYYEVYVNDELLFSPESTNAQLELEIEGSHSVQIKPCSALGCGPMSAPVNLQVAANLGPVAADISLTITQQSPSLQQNLAELVVDSNGIDWTTLQLIKPEQGLISAQGSILTIDYANVHFEGELRLNYRVSDLLGAPSNTGFIILNVKVLQIPSIPRELNLYELSPSEQLSVNWQASQGEGISYHVEHQLNSDDWQLVQANSLSPSIVFSDPVNGIHRFRVKACRESHNLCSEFAKTSDILIAKAPKTVERVLPPTVNSEGQIRLQWLATTNAISYTIEQQKDGLDWQPLQQNVLGTLLLVNVEGNGQYQFKVLACNEVGCSAGVTSAVATLAYVPDSPAIVNLVIDEESNAQLSWSHVELADGYMVQTQVEEQWLGLNGNDSQMQYPSNTLALNEAPDGKIRVQACNSFGCSEAPTLAVVAKNSTTPISAFYAGKTILSVGSETSLHWDVRDAAEVSLSSEFADNYENLPATGSIMIAPEQSTQYVLHAKAHSLAQAYSQTVDVVVNDIDEQLVTVLPSNSTMSPIISSIAVQANGNQVFGDLQDTITNVDAEGNIIWQHSGVGTIYSPPTFSADGTIYFTSTTNEGKGKFCGIDNLGTEIQCTPLAQPVIGAAAISVNSALIVDLYGGTFRINLTTYQVTALSALPTGKQVRSTPVLTTSNALVVRTTVNDIYMLNLNADMDVASWTQTLAGEQ